MLTIRQARPSDCDAICAVHRDAILRHCSTGAAAKQAREWADRMTAEFCEQWLESTMVIVADELGTLLAFAAFDPANGHIEVSATRAAEERAIPAALVAVVEAEARVRDLDVLRVLAMPGSDKLFTGYGYAVEQGHAAATPSLPGPPSIPLSKKLTYLEPRPERRRNGSLKVSPP
jgi:hypothetical protein